MKIILTTIFSLLLLSVTTVNGNSPVIKETAFKQAQKYTCVFNQSNPYPDGTTGIAYIGVKITGKGTTVVTVSYFSDNGQSYLGQYEEINGNFVPSNADEACQFALDHFGQRT